MAAAAPVVEGPYLTHPSIQIRDGEGRLRSFLKSELAELRKSWGKSPMPSYKGVLSSAEIDDLVAYLASLRGIK